MVWKAAIALSGLGLIFGGLLAVASAKFKVETDPRVDEVLDVLGGSNCGACGYPSCERAAAAIVSGEAPVDACLSGGGDVAGKVAKIMGTEAKIREKKIALVHCKGGLSESVPKAVYHGIDSCLAAVKVAGGGKACSYGCLGLGTCKAACPVNAIIIDEDRRRWVNRDKCTGCGLCVEACPRGLIELVPRKQEVLVVCKNIEKGAKAKRVCRVCCNGCKKCEKVCEVGAIKVADNLARIDYEKCNQCGKCIEVCPNQVIVRVVPARASRRKAKEPSVPLSS